MKSSVLATSLLLSGLIAAGNPAMASDEVAGAVIGGGAGAVLGHVVGGDQGAVFGGILGAVLGVAIADDDDRHHHGHRPPPAVVHAPVRVHYPYAAPPLQYQYRPAPYWGAPRQVHHHRWNDRDLRHDRGWDRDRGPDRKEWRDDGRHDGRDDDRGGRDRDRGPRGGGSDYRRG
jgi:hypothetical protein